MPSPASHRTTIATLAGVALLAAATACANRSAEVVDSAGGDVAATGTGEKWSANLMARTRLPIGGTAVLSPSSTEGQVVVMVSLQGSPTSTGAHPWRLVDAPCDTRGRIVGDAVDYPYIVMRADGTGQATANLPVTDLGTAYSVRVYASGTNDTIIACGDLQRGRF
ncbi:MAG TPA: hypothetical protein VFS08_04740 [Gemmatimonadaceae bacterium]|nr:hypothetical protein [Gemmatimonadaceae bacterium]